MRVRSLSLLTVTAVVLFSLTELHAQALGGFNRRFPQDFHFNWDFYGGGARAAGMGNAYAAVKDPAFAMGWNPAAISDVEQIYLGFDWSGYSPSGKYDFSANSQSRELSHDGGESGFFHDFAISLPANIKDQKFAVGGGIKRSMDTYFFMADKIYPHPSSPGNPDITVEREGSLQTGYLGIATDVSSRLSVGVTANVHFGNVTIVNQRTEIYENQLEVNTVQPYDGTILTNEIDSFALSGFNFTLGALYELSDETNLGLTVKTPFKVRLSNDVTIERIVLFNGVQAPGGLSDTVIFTDRDSKVEMPLMVQLGAAHQFSERFLGSIDFDFRAYSGSQFQILDSFRISSTGNREDFFHDEESGWSSALQVRIGGEYTMETKLGKLPLRAGFGYLPQPFGDIQEYNFTFNGRTQPILPIGLGLDDTLFTGGQEAFTGNQDVDLYLDAGGSQVTAISFSLGTGLHSAQRMLDIAYTFTTYSQSISSSMAWKVPDGYDVLNGGVPTLEQTTRSATNKVTDHRFMVSFTGYF